ncbi:MAG: PLP-dependent transferase [Verrucomicrobiales bacterium]|nr:PLP-dependent transferase [Verrucomicrobiales bacterium]
MKPRDLLTAPRWEGADLGQPLPDSVHAVSVALPRWQDVVGYEEKRPEVLAHLGQGYPRFLIHPLVLEVSRMLAPDQPCLPFPSPAKARAAATFITRTTGAPAEVVQQRGLAGVRTNLDGEPALRAFWQHTGWIVSSRQAEAWLADDLSPPETPEILRSLRRQLAAWYDCAEDDVFLTPTGMAAQATALEAVRHRTPDRPTAQLGFPYVDTLKLQEKFGHGAHLLPALERIAEDLEAVLQRGPLAACFCEIPGNPLLGSADLARVTPVVRRHRVPLVVDDVVATPLNVDLRPHADLIATSLTKYIVGTGDAMGGAVICNPRSPYHAALKPRVQAGHEELLWGSEARVIEQQGRTFPERMRRHNANGLCIAERLRQHPAVECVWYPRWEFQDRYEAVRRPDGGWGSLVTFLPRDAAVASPRCYDRLALCKGPSLGTVFTLACPFTLLAHYGELAWAEACGVSRHLIRLSVGLEDPEWIWARIARALGGASPAAADSRGTP